jgi:phage terminase large subunit
MAVEYQPHPKQIAAHRAFLIDDYKRGTLFWGRQVGKTMWSVYQAWMSALMHQGQYFIVFRTYSQASQVVWKQYLHTIPKELIAGKQGINNDDLRVTFRHFEGTMKLPGIGWVKVKHNPDLPPSTIRLLGSDQAESHRGNKAHGIIFDEYADQNPDNWEEVYKYFFTTTKGWAAFMGTPKGYNHWYDMLEYANVREHGWYFSKATWRDNPVIDPEWVAREREEADQKGQLNAFLQEMELEFRAVQGSVYPSFKRNLHTCRPDQIPDVGTDYITIDFGYADDHPMAVNFVRVDIEDRWWVYDELHLIKTELDVAIEDIKRRMAERRITTIVGDGARPDLIAYMQSKGLPVIAAPKGSGSILSGIDLLRIRLRPRIQLLGDPKPQIIFSTVCKFTILDFEQYKYPEAKKDRPATELPVKKDDDHPDGLRYLALYLKSNSSVKDKIPAPMNFGEFGVSLPL